MNGTDDPSLTARIERLADGPTELGHLADPCRRAALHAVPRHRFVLAAAWAVPDRPGDAGLRIDRDADPGGWWDAVHADTAITTQVGDGAGDPTRPAGPWTSSCSASHRARRSRSPRSSRTSAPTSRSAWAAPAASGPSRTAPNARTR